MAIYKNITGELTQELIEVGKNSKTKSISLTNIHGSTKCTVDLYVEKKLLGKFYVLKDVTLPIGATLTHPLSFDNSLNAFGLYIKLTKSASETPAVDVIIK